MGITNPTNDLNHNIVVHFTVTNFIKSYFARSVYYISYSSCSSNRKKENKNNNKPLLIDADI